MAERVERFEPFVVSRKRGDPRMRLTPIGSMVRYSDYEKLEAEVERVRRHEQETAEVAVQRIKALEVQRDQTRQEVLEEVRGLVEEQLRHATEALANQLPQSVGRAGAAGRKSGFEHLLFLLAAVDPSGGEKASGDELALRLADAQAVVQTVIDSTDEDGMEELECSENGILGGFFSALDHALRGTQGCLDDDEFAAKRTAALEKHREYLRLPHPSSGEREPTADEWPCPDDDPPDPL